MSLLDLAVLGLAVARLSRLVALDSLLESPRETFLTRWPAPDTIFGDSEVTGGPEFFYLSKSRREVIRTDQGWTALRPYWWAELVSCYWCNSFWIAIIIWAGYSLYPVITVSLMVPFALSQIAGFVNDR